MKGRLIKILEKFKYDYYRYTSEKWSIRGYNKFFTCFEIRYLFILRLIDDKKFKILRPFLKIIKHFQSTRRGLEFSGNNIGKGLFIGHTYNITINPEAVLGNNINIHKGVTIGRENRGHRKGAPVIGNSVWIGVNSTVVGKISIGDDVMIAPNSYVNCNVPNHSIVIGNPCKIISKENATEGYINNIFEELINT